jgi:hypothetical protein
MSNLISKLGDITEITPTQEASLAKANEIIGCGVPMAYEGRGGSTQFIYNDPDGEESDMRLILDADGSFVDLEMWDNEEATLAEDGSYDDDWVSIDGGEMGEQIQAALKA